MTALKRLAICGFIVIAAATSGSASSGQQMTVSLMDALTLYELGEHTEVIAALGRARGGDADALLQTLTRDVPEWIASDGEAEAPRRRMIAATFMLEVGHAAIDEQWELTRLVTDWACELVRSTGPPTELERQWHLAALALLEANFEVAQAGALGEPGAAVRQHVKHIAKRFPEEPRIALAEALVSEYDYWTAHVASDAGATTVDRRRNEPEAGLPIGDLNRAVETDATRAEAQLRIGFLEYKRGNLDRALELLQSAAVGDDDDTRVYLAHLFAGWTHEKAGRSEAAVASFRRALSAVNGLSAALALGVRLYAVDARDEADDIVLAAMDKETAVADPFKEYGYGDFRRWPSLIVDLRGKVLTR